MIYFIAITLLGVLVAAALAVKQTPLPQSRRFQFRLRTLLIATALFAIVARWAGSRYIAMSVIRSSASDYEYDGFDSIGIASYEGTGIGDDDLKRLRWYFEHHPHLVTLDLSGTTRRQQTGSSTSMTR